ncbi:MAG: agmatine deiminase family protein, partial [Pyrinomonadaceae bacterium]
NLLVDSEEVSAGLRNRLTFNGAANVQLHLIETVDSWIRDYGPNFLIDNDGHLAFNHWAFNAWGNKYEELKRDSRIPELIAPLLDAQSFAPGIVLEGGSIDVNGNGVVITTEQCLLCSNRNPQVTRQKIEWFLCEYLGVNTVVWLGEGIAGDDTDGHVDDIARFTSERVIVCSIEEDREDGNYALLQDNLRRLQLAKDAHGRNFEIVTIPMPDVVMGREGGLEGEQKGGQEERLPASYANFYIANNLVLAPIFGHQNDERAVETLARLFPARKIIPINCEPLVWGMGAIHCVTQQEPQVANLRKSVPPGE